MLRSLEARVAAFRWKKIADTESLDHEVDEFMLLVGHQIASGIAKDTHAHVKSVTLEHGHVVQVEVMTKAMGMVHHFHVHLSIDPGLQVVGILDYESMGSGGGDGRKKSVVHLLPGNATPTHFVRQIVDAALEQYHGKSSPAKVVMMASWKALGQRPK